MSTRLYITSIEGCNEFDELMFNIKMFDAGAVEVELRQCFHNAASWREMADDIGKAIDMMELESDAEAASNRAMDRATA